jgi:hypothetical protein
MNSLHFREYGVTTNLLAEQGLVNVPEFIPIMPASRFSSSLHVRSMFFVKKYEARPICSFI